MPLHSALTGSDLHEPKGAASAAANTVYQANGLGSGTWAKIDNDNTATNYYISRTVATGTISSAAQFDISIPSNCDIFEIDLLNIRPATNAANLHMRWSQSGTFLSGASDYAWTVETNGPTLLAADLNLAISLSQSNAAGAYGTHNIKIYRPNATSFTKTMLHYGWHANTTSTRFVAGGGKLIANTNPIDGVRFMFSSGNVAECYYIARAHEYE